MRHRLMIAMLAVVLPGATISGPPLPGAAGPRVGDIHVVTVQLANPAQLQVLFEQGFNVSSRHGNTVEIYATEPEVARLRELGFDPVPVAHAKTHEGDIAGYHSYDEVTQVLEGYATSYPDLTHLISLGQSVEGRELWAIMISDNPNVEEAEPEFKYVSTIHGDEPVGTEMILLLIDRLLSDYGSDPRITSLVDETAMWFVPVMNPDGLENVARYNANRVDLNRAFPQYGADFTGTWFDGDDPGVAGREPEVQHMMNWTLENSFVLSANFHTGSLVVNYPYDFEPGVPSGSYAIAPDDALFREISLRYSEHNEPMFANPAFSQGITNGSDWYSITGGMQDWNYRYVGVNEVTIELANTKRPHYSTLMQYWAENEESMLRYLESVHVGIRGLVIDDTGMPVWAEVRLEGNTQPVFTDPDVGDYYRMALPGTYTLIVRADGFFTKTIHDVEVLTDMTGEVDVTLADADIDNDGFLGATDVQWVINATLGMNVPYETDIDGGGPTATDIQKIVNAVLEAIAG